MYGMYCRNYMHATDILKVNQERRSFVQFLNKQQRLSEAEGHDLASYLIMPVQRIARYRLLLQELHKFTPTMHVDYEALQQAIQLVSATVDSVNAACVPTSLTTRILDTKR